MEVPSPVETPPQRVTVVDIDISFGQLVTLVVKGTLALLFVGLFVAVLGFLGLLLFRTAVG